MNIYDLLNNCIKYKASDLHLSSDAPIMLRINGNMKIIPDSKFSADEIDKIIFDLLNIEQKVRLETNKSCDFGLSLNSGERFRVNIFTQRRGLSAVFRLINREPPSLNSLNLPDSIQSLLDLEQGLILVTGPTGSGKSTTLASMLSYINKHQARHIITIEDPIEYIYKSQQSLISQREINTSCLGFSSAIRDALREDPDIIMVGEMRDSQTIRNALTAAETGHLVFATLHTNSAAQTITRIIDTFAGGEQKMIRTMLAQSILAIIAQRLVLSTNDSRIAAYEIMLATPAIRNLIRENKIAQMQSVIQTSGEKGMQTLEQSLHKLKVTGKIN